MIKLILSMLPSKVSFSVTKGISLYGNKTSEHSPRHQWSILYTRCEGMISFGNRNEHSYSLLRWILPQKQDTDATNETFGNGIILL